MDITILFLIGFVGCLIKQGVVAAFTAETEIGYCEGDVCGRNGCRGIIEARSVENCSCHISPPCGACTSPREYCDECEWDAEDDDE